ncbi:MAG: hypothetical protein AAF566_10670 [Pseudomonadota bacterium]
MWRLPPIVLAGGLLALTAAGLGLSLGLRWAPVSETEVIETWAADYVRETGGTRTDCAATPDPRQDVWMVIRCGQGDKGRVYPVDRMGRLVLPDARAPST